MNRDRIEQLWDDYRDGRLSPDDRAAFEAHLRRDGRSASLWRAENAWLAELAGDDDVNAAHDNDGALSGALTDGAFTAAAVARWQRGEDVTLDEPAAVTADDDGPAVVARVDWRRRTAGWLAAAAAVALVAWVGYTSQPRTPAPTNVAVTQPDPLGVLVRDMNDQVAEQPARIRQAVQQTASYLNVNRVLSLLEVPMPDPAHYVEPKDKNS